MNVVHSAVRVGLIAAASTVLIGLAGIAYAQVPEAQLDQRGRAHDPGPRPLPASRIPQPIPNLEPNEMKLFQESILRLSELEGSCDTCSLGPQNVPPVDPDPQNPFSPDIDHGLVNSAGMSPTFNADQCFICHFQPVVGGSSPVPNPAIKIANRLGGTNFIPSFEKPDGPIKEVHFKFTPDGQRDGGVHSLFTLQGRTDAPNCTLKQPDFAAEQAKQNLTLRIPLQITGLGLIESIQDKAILANMNANQGLKQALGIHGHPNIVPNNGTISRFGWKAQNGSINIFAGEAYNVEMGITNDLFPIARNEDDNCNLAYEPFDVPRTDDDLYNNPLKIMPAWLMFTVFMRFVDAPRPVPFTASAKRGQELFTSTGCGLCHNPQFKTRGIPQPGITDHNKEIGPHVVALRGQDVNLYSDLLLHHMGATLADNIIQGRASQDEFRTTPLWGIGQRLFFLHDGRTNNLLTAIEDHFSAAGSDGGDNPAKDSQSRSYGPSEANAVVQRFNNLSERDKQSILDFLRSL